MTTASPYSDALARIPARDRVVSVLGVGTHFVEYGPLNADRTVVLVHGFRGDHHGLGPVVAQLPGIRFLAPDLPGFGTSEPLLDRPHDLNGYVAWLEAFLHATGVHGTAVLLGHSFGSIVVSAAVAAGVPTPRVILVNPIGQNALVGPRGVLTRSAVLFYRMGAALPERLGFALLRSRLVTRIMSVTMAKTDDTVLLRWIHEEHDRYFSAFANRRSLLEAFRASVSHDVSEFAAHVAPNTLLIVADQDDITPLDAQRRVVTLFPDAQLEVIEGVGHLVHYEKPVEAAAAIRAFLA
jgi:pimeloyl-ACP methyl ester carboxylesterase